MWSGNLKKIGLLFAGSDNDKMYQMCIAWTKGCEAKNYLHETAKAGRKVVDSKQKKKQQTKWETTLKKLGKTLCKIEHEKLLFVCSKKQKQQKLKYIIVKMELNLNFFNVARRLIDVQVCD